MTAGCTTLAVFITSTLRPKAQLAVADLPHCLCCIPPPLCSSLRLVQLARATPSLGWMVRAAAAAWRCPVCRSGLSLQTGPSTWTGGKVVRHMRAQNANLDRLVSRLESSQIALQDAGHAAGFTLRLIDDAAQSSPPPGPAAELLSSSRPAPLPGWLGLP